MGWYPMTTNLSNLTLFQFGSSGERLANCGITASGHIGSIQINEKRISMQIWLNRRDNWYYAS